MMSFNPSEKIVFYNLIHDTAAQPGKINDEYWQDCYKLIVDIVARNGVTGCAEFSEPQYVEQWHNYNREVINLAAQGLKAKHGMGVGQCQPSSSLPDYSLDETLRTLMALVQSGASVSYLHSTNIYGTKILVSARTQSDRMDRAGGVLLTLTVTSTHSAQPVT
jgi:hypothetical protein